MKRKMKNQRVTTWTQKSPKRRKKRFASTVTRRNIPSMASKAITTRFTESFKTFMGILSIAATLAKMFFQANLTWKITCLVIMVTINVLIRHWENVNVENKKGCIVLDQSSNVPNNS